jgi:hypothetical protein
LLVWGATTLVMVLLPLIFRQGFALSMLSQMGIAIIFALSYNMLLDRPGCRSATPCTTDWARSSRYPQLGAGASTSGYLLPLVGGERPAFGIIWAT